MVKMKMCKIYLMILTASILTGCVTPTQRIRLEVDNAFNREYPIEGQSTYVQYRGKSKEELSLDEIELLRMSKVALARAGLKIADSYEQAELIIAVSFDISAPEDYTYEEPIYSFSGGTTTYGGTVSSGSGYGQPQDSVKYEGSYTQPQTLQVEGFRTVSATRYRRYLTIWAFDRQVMDSEKYAGKVFGKIPRVWECDVISTGSSGSLEYIAPYLLVAMERHFGNFVSNREVILVSSEAFKERYFPYTSSQE